MYEKPQAGIIRVFVVFNFHKKLPFFRVQVGGTWQIRRSISCWENPKNGAIRLFVHTLIVLNPFLENARFARWLFFLEEPYLIEPWWKIVCPLALKGQRFETLQQMCDVIQAETTDWHVHLHPPEWGNVGIIIHVADLASLCCLL